ncbi:MAG: bifunctional oligoribonuclease/PAP phosphatase NrnA [Candidatus Paceibacterota bacterium]|jgi:phosphoesterase RecJ-like protein
MTNIRSKQIIEKAPLILEEIKKAKSILLHCHPMPDPDSVGSALAMKFVLEGMGKKVTVIEGDSALPEGFKHFPGAGDIIKKKFLETDLSSFDLFISLDSAQIQMITRRGEVIFPEGLKVIAIDHHTTNGMYGSINLVDSSYPANCQLLFDLFEEWGINMTPDISANLFIGIYADTGGFRYPGTNARTYFIAGKLVEMIPDVSALIGGMMNSNSPEFIALMAEGLRSIEVYFDRFAISSIPLSFLNQKKIPISEVRASEIASYMSSVANWDIVASAVEIEVNKVKFSFRSKDGEKYDVAKLAATMGGGGHKAASGLILSLPLNDAKELVVSKIKELYNVTNV